MARSIATLVGALVAALTLASAARADAPLEVATREHGAWIKTVEALQRDLHAQGSTVHVRARRLGALVPCDAYELHLDAAATRAFVVAGCDPATKEIALTLVDRAALFDRSRKLAAPRAVAIEAVTPAPRAPSPAVPDAVDVVCTARVRPATVDMLTGARVELGPKDAALTARGDVEVTADGDAFVIASHARPPGKIAYVALDRGTGAILARGAVDLACDAVAPPPAAAPPEPRFQTAATREPMTELFPELRRPQAREPWRLMVSGQCLTPVAHWKWGSSAAWVAGRTCNGGFDVTVPFHPADTAGAHPAGWISADFGAVHGTDGAGDRFWAADIGIVTLGVAEESRWFSLRTGLSFRYFSHGLDLSGVNLGTGQGAGYAYMAADLVVFGGVISELALHAPLGERWLFGVVGQGRLLQGIPGVIELGGGVTIGRRM
ncbi:MAG TPA: hypothetical protein VGM56_14665 [Byssovorax sp.]